MRLLLGRSFDGLFREFERTAFHLEVRDVYHAPEEAVPFQRFLDAEPDDFAWQRPWLELVREVTDAGRSVRRLRVVPVPHRDYTRWLLSISGNNVDAGEEIRWLDRTATAGLTVGTDDFWLFDDRRVVFSLFEPDGSFSGGAVTEDPEIVRYCARARTSLWAAGIPHDVYLARQAVTG
ncbi:DUF6879 family protein [Actinoplanes derwentensis]|uniref:DUF6879 domain-containing protein n=1 Tax=Actinoplanes derwentensis TaxID=113562 RepID=A0A1H2DGA5_9ACTN|nr:DUF6879 family protein [Actinoplanes derwentensis]SDT81266.1 hypothetical protein SAMN04489716_9563 [Actinoplanes derwentensis]